MIFMIIIIMHDNIFIIVFTDKMIIILCRSGGEEGLRPFKG